MADVCRSCAMRAQRNVASTFRRQVQGQQRSFTATAVQGRHVGPPSFSETSSPELDATLLTLRDQYFIPAYLNKRQRHLIYGDKFKTELENNPAYATLGEEEVQLQHVNRRTDIPARRPLVKKALSLMREHEDWKQVPALLEGLQKATTSAKPSTDLLERVVRKAIEADQYAVVLACLRRADVTALTMKNDNILNLVIWGVRSMAESGAWDEEHITKALKYADEVAQLLESEAHGTGRRLAANDPRTRPEVIAIFLELYAVNAYKHHGGSDSDGNVRKYVERLMACFADAKPQRQKTLRPESEYMLKLPIWHALTLSQKILGPQFPQSNEARAIAQKHETRLNELLSTFEPTAKSRPGYARMLVESWKACIRD